MKYSVSEADLQRSPAELELWDRPAEHLESKSHPGSIGELVCYTLSAGVVVTLYMVIPWTLTLIPFLPPNWSRLLITLEALAVGEFVICGILMKTTMRTAKK